MMRRLLTLGPENEPMWVRLYVRPIGITGPPCSSAMMSRHPSPTP